MNVDTIKMPVRELAIGMKVVKLDRPWLGTPFLLQGFRISSKEELRLLAQHCNHVYIELKQGVTPAAGRGELVTLNEEGDVVEMKRSVSALAARERDAGPADPAALPRPAVNYALESDFSEELPHTRAALAATKAAVKVLIDTVREGRLMSLDTIKGAAVVLEESMLRNPDPAMLLRALSNDEPFSFRHCVNSTMLAISMARALGLRRQTIHELTMGMLLADLGKLRLPKELLRAHRRLDKRETEIIKLHVKFGVEIATDLGGLTPGTLDVVVGHHERFDGSGYPRALEGGAIPLLARIAGLADTFDAITSERAYSAAIVMHEAVQELYAATVEVFQRELVETLITVLGTHPIGSLVELADGSIALVVAQNRERRLLPWVMSLSDTAKRPLATRDLRNLAAAGGPTVRQVLDPGSHGFAMPGLEILPA
jgi:HD-GYP domain-containing protein (c-di-GMP phosphodiesterase class II)